MKDFADYVRLVNQLTPAQAKLLDAVCGAGWITPTSRGLMLDPLHDVPRRLLAREEIEAFHRLITLDLIEHRVGKEYFWATSDGLMCAGVRRRLEVGSLVVSADGEVSYGKTLDSEATARP